MLTISALLGRLPGRPAGVRAVLDPLGIELSFREQDRDGFDTLLFDDMTFAVPAGMEQFGARLREFFPGERGAIDRYLRRLMAVAEELEEAVPGRIGKLPSYAWRTRDFLAASTTTLGRELDRLDCSPRLRTVLSYLWGTYAVPPSRAAFAIHAMVTLHYLRGAWYPEGGARSISDALVEVIERNGGELLLDTEASAIIVDNGTVRCLRVKPGPGGSEPRAREQRMRLDRAIVARDMSRLPSLAGAGDVRRENNIPRWVSNGLDHADLSAVLIRTCGIR